MIPAGPILQILLQLPACYEDRNDSSYPERMAIIAHSIAAVSDNDDEAATLVTIASFESGLCRAVHEGRKRGGPGEGLWQIEPGSHRVPPFSGLSFEATEHAAGEALWLWRHSFQCGPSLESRFKGYGGRSCSEAWTGASRRARFAGWLTQKLKSLALAESTILEITNPASLAKNAGR